LVAYEVYRGPHSQYGQIPGTLQPVLHDLAPVFR